MEQVERHDAELHVIMQLLHWFCSYFLHKHNFDFFVSFPNIWTASHCALLSSGYRKWSDNQLHVKNGKLNVHMCFPLSNSAVQFAIQKLNIKI
jgi:hypothetical protein